MATYFPGKYLPFLFISNRRLWQDCNGIFNKVPNALSKFITHLSVLENSNGRRVTSNNNNKHIMGVGTRH